MKLNEAVPVELIDIGERRREDMKDIESLATSIKENELISPIALEECNGRYKLLAGGRRLMACMLLEKDTIAARIYEPLDGATEDQKLLRLRTIELSENFDRADLDWKELASLQKEIHDLHIAVYGKKTSTVPDAEGWTQNDTARLLGKTRSEITTNLSIADAVASFPELFEQCKTANDAKKVMKEAGRRYLQSEAAKKFEQDNLGNEYQRLANSYVLEDFFTGVKKLADNSIDLVELDPPFGIDLTKIKSDSIGKSDYNEVDAAEYKDFMFNVFKECYRVMSANSWIICWFGPEPWFEFIYQAMLKVGFSGRRICGIWTKPAGQTNAPAKNLGHSYEMFFYMRKGNPSIIKMGRSDVFPYPPIPPQHKVHPTERPVELIKEVLETFTNPNSNILVPFLGSGNTLIAAHLAKMKGIGYELSKPYRDSYLVKLERLRKGLI